MAAILPPCHKFAIAEKSTNLFQKLGGYSVYILPDSLAVAIFGDGWALVEYLIDNAECLGFLGFEESIAVHRFFHGGELLAGMFD